MQNEKLQTDNNTMPGFVAIALGGTGKESVKTIQKMHQAAGNPFAIYTMAIDTDPLDFEQFDFSIDIAPTRDLVNAMVANPQKYGIACRTIIKHHKGLLDYETLGHGSRTTRIVTQAAFELHETRIVKGLCRAVQSVLEQGRCRWVMPVITASFGGGTGSAAVILLLDFFTDDTKKKET